MVRVLYDPTIQPGMGREQAMAAATAIIDRLVGIGWFLPLN